MSVSSHKSQKDRFADKGSMVVFIPDLRYHWVERRVRMLTEFGDADKKIEENGHE